MPQFNGTLNANEFYNALFNAYRLVTTFADGLDGLDSGLANRFKIDGGKYEDKLVYTDMDIIKSRVWDPTDTNVLATEQKVVPVQQVIEISQKRQIALTAGEYLAKRAWMKEDSFSSFNSVVQSQVGNTKKVYEQRLVSAYIGTMEAAMPSGKGSGQSVTINIASNATPSMRVREIGQVTADLIVDIKDSTRDYNDYGFMKSYDESKLLIIWNTKYLNEFRIKDLPVIFHKDGIIKFDGEKLPGRYFGHRITEDSYSTYSASTPTTGKPIDSDDGTYVPGDSHANGTLRALEEMDIKVSDVTTHVFPGDELPAGAVVYASSEVKIPCYIEDAKVIYKIVHVDSIKFPTGFETSTEFFNVKNLTTNRYLTWMYANPEYLYNYPMITAVENTVPAGD